ncbi:MAG: hypothetical protein GQ565_02985 [Candidatus Aegiribacteria sp.]|nr:hypothetical protein [Candidatus Aegiribacteria sp.]
MMAKEYREQTVMSGRARPIVGGQKPPRNAPCPCGSGAKFKRCCGAGVGKVRFSRTRS